MLVKQQLEKHVSSQKLNPPTASVDGKKPEPSKVDISKLSTNDGSMQSYMTSVLKRIRDKRGI